MAKKTPKSTNKASETENQPPLIGPNTTFKIKIDQKTAQAAYKKALNTRAKNLKTDGFRKGKVPANIAESMLDKNTLIDDALQAVVPSIYQEEIIKRKLQPITYPEFRPISLELDKDWELEVHIAERPEVKLGNYKKFVKAGKKEAEKHEKEMEKEAKKSNKGKKDPQPTHQHQGRNHSLQHIYSNLIEGIKPQIPELLVKTQVRSELENLVSRIENMGMMLDDFLKQRGITFEQLSADMTQQALSDMQISFILDEISREEKIKVEDSEVDDIINKIEDQQQKKHLQADPQYRQRVRQSQIRIKLADFLMKI